MATPEDEGLEDQNVEERDTPEEKPTEKEKPVEEQMLEGIKAAITPKDTEGEAKKKEEAAAQAKADEGKTPEQIAEAKVAADAKKKADADAAEKEKNKGKRADDFQLTDEEKKVWKQEGQRRFNELRGYAKANEAEARRLSEENTALSTARDNMMSVFKDTHTTPEDLTALLDYNIKLKTGDLKGALAIVDEARKEILKALNQEAPGVDLLEEFPDLKGKVDNLELERPSALELAAARRREAQSEQQRKREEEQRQQDASGEQVQQQALDAITKWDKEMAGGDMDYEVKSAKVNARVKGVMSAYPPRLWLVTLKNIYDSIEVVKPAGIPGKGDTPLRPTGAKTGAKVFDTLSPEAIRAGLRDAGHPYN